VSADDRNPATVAVALSENQPTTAGARIKLHQLYPPIRVRQTTSVYLFP
jgi:hypothetical protein